MAGGIEVIYDDRNVRPGVMFSDADLLGVPYRVIVSPRNMKENVCEFVSRDKRISEKLELSNVVKYVSDLIKTELDKGNSYPKAREISLKKVLSSENVEYIMQKPNNILAIEYLKALKITNSSIKPFAIKRKNSMHHDKNINENYASGTYIRKLFIENNFDEISKVVPKYTYEKLLELKSHGTYVTSINDFSDIVIYKIRMMTKEEISKIADVNEGLENSIKLASTTCKTIDEIIDKVSTKRYTKTRISRILTYILLDITKLDMEQSKNNDPYIRVLGINKQCEEILSTINNDKLITSLKKFEENNGENQLLNIDKKATEIYTIKYPKSVDANLDYTSKFIIKI